MLLRSILTRSLMLREMVFAVGFVISQHLLHLRTLRFIFIVFVTILIEEIHFLFMIIQLDPYRLVSHLVTCTGLIHVL